MRLLKIAHLASRANGFCFICPRVGSELESPALEFQRVRSVAAKKRPRDYIKYNVTVACGGRDSEGFGFSSIALAP